MQGRRERTLNRICCINWWTGQNKKNEGPLYVIFFPSAVCSDNFWLKAGRSSSDHGWFLLISCYATQEGCEWLLVSLPLCQFERCWMLIYKIWWSICILYYVKLIISWLHSQFLLQINNEIANYFAGVPLYLFLYSCYIVGKALMEMLVVNCLYSRILISEGSKFLYTWRFLLQKEIDESHYLLKPRLKRKL